MARTISSPIPSGVLLSEHVLSSGSEQTPTTGWCTPSVWRPGGLNTNWARSRWTTPPWRAYSGKHAFSVRSARHTGGSHGHVAPFAWQSTIWPELSPDKCAPACDGRERVCHTLDHERVRACYAALLPGSGQSCKERGRADQSSVGVPKPRIEREVRIAISRLRVPLSARVRSAANRKSSITTSTSRATCASSGGTRGLPTTSTCQRASSPSKDCF